MKAIVVYESHWGNTAAIARAIAEGIGPDARALSTAEATAAALAGADLIVAGAPLLGFSLPTDGMIKSLATNQAGGPAPDLSHPGMRAWLAALPGRTRPRGRVRDAHLVVARQRSQDDPARAGTRRLCIHRQARPLHRAGEIRPAPRWRAGAGAKLGAELARAMVGGA